MPTARDEEFIRFAAASGYLSEEQAREALGALRNIEELGGTASAPELLQKRGALSERQVALVHQAVASSKAATKVPRELGGFELIEKIGQGGMGSVFKARQKELGRVVAVKVLSPRLARSGEFVERFLREARSAGRLSHPNIVAAIDVGESQGFYYFAMEYVEGETLARLVAREGPLAEERALRIAADVARALDHAHQKGLIHRDIKPDNVIVTPDGRVRVTDFGLAKAIGEGAPAGTDEERFLGTPAYVAPEQIRSEPGIDCRADIFSLGVMLFQMLTGQLPFTGANPMAVAAAVVSEPLPSMRKLRPDLSPATVRVVERMTAKDPAQRYSTPAQVVEALEAAAAAPRLPAPRPVATRALATRQRSSHTMAYVSAAGILLAVGVLAVVALSRGSGARPQGKGTDLLPAVAPPATPMRVVPPDPTPRVTPGEALMRDLTRAIERANRFEEQNPRDLAEVAARLRAVLDEFPPARRVGLPAEGTELLKQTEGKLRDIEGRIAKAVDGELQDRSSRADALLDAGKISEALALLDTFPNALRTPAAATRLDELRNQLHKRAVEHFNTRDAQGKKLLAEGELSQAKALYVAYAACAVEEIAARAKQALKSIEEDYTKKLAEAQRAARGLYVKEAKAIFAHLDARELREARALADAAVVNPALAPLREETKDLQHLVRCVAEVWASAGAGAKRLRPGDKVRIGGFAGEVVEATEDRIALKMGAVSFAKRLADLRASDLVELALRGYGSASAHTEAKLGLFLLAEHAYDEARRRIESARGSGMDVARELALLARFSPQECPACKGTKSIPCPDCAGRGAASIEQQECDVCKGKGGGPCGYCKAKGRLRCSNCGGTGRIAGGAFVCPECANGWVRCSRCGGTGHLKCSKCKATGFLTIVTPCARCRGSKTAVCPNCAGKGLLPPPGLVEPAEPAAKP